jgi:putative ABC transport system permease protein
MGLENPIGENIKMWDEPGEIIGVVKDFHHVSLHKKILPHIISINPKHYGALKYIFIKISSSEVQQSIDHIQATTKKFIPDYAFEFKFIDEEINTLYYSEQKLSRVIIFFTLIALLISTLGVFGMTAFLVEQRTKEIGIRKINGATVSNIIFLFDKKILSWVVIASIIAGPIAYIISYIWLINFAYKTPLSLWIIFLAGGIATVIALLTSGYETVKAALKNPVNSLRYE